MARLRGIIPLAIGKPTVRSPQGRGTGCVRPESLAGDPKPVDLYLARLKPWETRVEDRTDIDVQIIRISWA